MQPNIVFILADQLRRCSVGCEGGPVQTPNLDALADEGTRFSQTHCVYPMCTPSRAALLTGRFCHALRDAAGRIYYDNNRLLSADETTFAHALTAADYRCAYIGKWHNDDGAHGAFVPRGSRRLGFDDEWYAVQPGSDRNHPFHFTDDGTRVDAGPMWEPDHQTDLAVDYLQRAGETRQPFCLFLSYHPPHRPFELSPEREHLFAEAREQLDTLRPNVPERLTEAAIEESVQYHANIMGIDSCVGRVLEALEEQGLKENTIVVFTSDHGEQLYSHGLRNKNQFYEESAAVPLFVRWPGMIPAGGHITTMTSLVDLAPTLLDLCGLAVPHRMQGRSLKSALAGESTSTTTPDSIYMEINHPWWDYFFGQGPQGHRRCVVTPEWKFVLIESHGGCGGAVPYELFNRREDPYEMCNLAHDPGHRPVVGELGELALRWMVRTEDPYLNIAMRGMTDQQINKVRKRYATL